MAAPAEITVKDLTGDWVMNKTLSDDTDAVLSLQGVGWLTRKAVGLATITLHVKQYNDDAGTTHVDIDQTLTGGIKGTSEQRQLDWTAREHEDHLFGKVKGQSRWATLDLPEDPFLKEGWIDDDSENGGPEGQRHIESFVVNEERGWDARQIWGFAIIDGKRYYTRRVVVSKGKEVLKVRLVYEYQAKN
ncbi:Uncharacterized protein BP5553_07508 [Venustampulla echinocandica]|uniref:LCCL domain-containing protein n=1 Tax=Venustampulla echinocandica TaxID=2656787 RepID=A0A370TGS1_9HELO|nr:Uncharacterized protein BP5553_07508 [Venustampulla echinocandica]RDL34380.1 Uncharacterized protein BP5553_07508 [Venustampulla echinocandica]